MTETGKKIIELGRQSMTAMTQKDVAMLKVLLSDACDGGAGHEAEPD